MQFANEAEKIHEQMYTDAGKTISEGKDLEKKSIHVCPVCGYTCFDEAPDNCPVCGVKKEKFQEF